MPVKINFKNIDFKNSRFIMNKVEYKKYTLNLPIFNPCELHTINYKYLYEFCCVMKKPIECVNFVV